jgi:hypothetical protein
MRKDVRVLGCELAGCGARRVASPAAATPGDRHQDPDRGRQGRAAQARPSQGKVIHYTVADPGCLYRIRIFSILDPRPRIEVF